MTELVNRGAETPCIVYPSLSAGVNAFSSQIPQVRSQATRLQRQGVKSNSTIPKHVCERNTRQLAPSNHAALIIKLSQTVTK